eukprot:7573176-Pyramimonas_sp.AAC.1
MVASLAAAAEKCFRALLHGGQHNTITIFVFKDDNAEAAIFTPQSPADQDWTREVRCAAPAPPPPIPPSEYKPVPKKKVRIMEYDMAEFFKSCISLCAELTDTDQD